ncbi:MAG TPA: tetratricopeptide repeat protein [Kofleriaceae bacterium]|nr:tetratricopeptide repeat protein [Kofleriaceae bacterium]
MFALIAVPAACGGDRSTQALSSGDSQVAKTVTPPAASDIKPMPVAPAKVEPAKPEPAPPAAPTTYSENLAQGKAAATSGDHARARELFEAAAKLDKKAAEPHIELSRLFITIGERHLAITAANKAVKLAGSSQAYNTLGRAELARFSYDDAMAAFHKAVELNPDNVWAWNNLGLAHLQLKNYQEAADALVEATSRKGAESYMFNNLGTAYEQLGQLDDARTAFESGGKLGSKEALASRKRLEGVKTIVVMKTDKPAKPDAKAMQGGYDIAEPMPDVPDATKATPEVAEPESTEPTDSAEPATGDSEEPSDTSGTGGDKAKAEVTPAPAPVEKPAAPSPL